jgi:hypothetical protein
MIETMQPPTGHSVVFTQRLVSIGIGARAARAVAPAA